MDQANRVQILDGVVCVSLNAGALGKEFISSSDTDYKIIGQTVLFSLGRAVSFGEGRL